MRLISYLLILVFWAAVPHESVAQNAQPDCPAHFEPPFQEKEIVVYSAADRKYKMRFRYPKDYEGSVGWKFPWNEGREETGFLLKIRISDGAPTPLERIKNIAPKYYRHFSVNVEGRGWGGIENIMQAYRPIVIKYGQPVDFKESGPGPFGLINIFHRGLGDEGVVKIYNKAYPWRPYKILDQKRTKYGVFRVIDSNNDIYIGRDGSKIQRYLRCSKPGTVPNPGCNHWVVYGDVQINMHYNRTELDQWSTIEKQMRKFWNCALISDGK